MKTKKVNSVLLVGCISIFIASILLVGCEDTERKMNLTITPQSTTLSQVGNTVVLTASMPLVNAAITNDTSELLYPLEWWVGDSEAGRIISSTGNSAVYYCDAGGRHNVVTVRDQGDREGLANIN